MLSDTLEQQLESIEGLPTLPLVLRQIQAVMNNERTSMAQIASVVAKDQALTSRAIRLVNSAWYGRTTKVTSIQQVLVTIGLKTLNTLMLGLTATKLFSTSESKLFSAQAFWEHAFGTALIAKKIALTTGLKGESEDFFVGGLLHDMGRLVLEQFFHDQFTAALELTHNKRISLIESEKEIFGFDHTDAGAFLGSKWNIPRRLVMAMKYHHTTSISSDILPEEREMVRIVSAANELCLSYKIGASGEEIYENKFSMSLKGISHETIYQLVEEARKEVVATLLQWSH